MCTPLKPVSFFVSPLYVRESGKVFKLKAGELRLRSFQHEIYERLANPDVPEVIRVSAPTGSGKTLALLIPFLVNIEHGWAYDGSVGIYPSRELAEDQMATLYNLLVEMGAEPADVGELMPELRGLPADARRELDSFMRLLAVEVDGKGPYPVLLLLVTSETLHRLGEIAGKAGFKPEARRKLLLRVASGSGDVFRVVFTVPEYPYLVSSGVYQEFEEAGRQLEAMLRELARFLKALERGGEELAKWFRELAGGIDRERMQRRYRVSRGFLRALARVFTLFRVPVFFDEFHLYSGFSLSSFISLLYIYMLERGVGKIVVSSATPEKLVKLRGKRKRLSELVEELARALGYEVHDVTAEVSHTATSGWVQVRKRTEVKVVPVVLRTDIVGAPAYGVLQRCLQGILKPCGWLEDYRVRQRSMILVDRVAAVFQAADAVERLTGEKPLRVCSVKKLFQDGDGKIPLKEAKLVVGNMAVAFGVDVKGMDLGVVVAKDCPTAVQKVGRIGRGEGSGHATVYLLIPMYKFQAVLGLLERIAGTEIQYMSAGGDIDFLRLMRLLYPSGPPDILAGSTAGIFKTVLPMWVYTLATIMRLRTEARAELHEARSLEDVRYLHQFALALRALSNFYEAGRLERRLRQFIRRRLHLTPLALYNLYSYRNIAGVTVKRRKPSGEVVEEVVDLVTAGRNIPLTYADGEFWVDPARVDPARPPYTYTHLTIRVDENRAHEAEQALKNLDGHIVTLGHLIDLIEGEAKEKPQLASHAELTQQTQRRIAGLARLRDNKTITQLPALIIHAKNSNREKLVNHLTATDTAIQIRAKNKTLGCIYLL